MGLPFGDTHRRGWQALRHNGIWRWLQLFRQLRDRLQPKPGWPREGAVPLRQPARWNLSARRVDRRGGTLYGTTDGGGSISCGGYPYYYDCGAVFSVTPSGTEKVLHSFSSPPDGALPAAPLIDVNGTLYGTTQYGGVHKNTCSGNCGTVFSITPSGTEKVLYSLGQEAMAMFPPLRLSR